jgi:hypothetical protein
VRFLFLSSLRITGRIANCKSKAEMSIISDGVCPFYLNAIVHNVRMSVSLCLDNAICRWSWRRTRLRMTSCAIRCDTRSSPRSMRAAVTASSGEAPLRYENLQ